MGQRLIDADALKNDILKSAVMIDDRGIQTGYEIAIELIKRQPTIDAVPVIRCKDCKHFNPMRKVWRCTQSMVGMISEAEDYCSRAELKEADG